MEASKAHSHRYDNHRNPEQSGAVANHDLNVIVQRTGGGYSLVASPTLFRTLRSRSAGAGDRFHQQVEHLKAHLLSNVAQISVPQLS